MSSTKPIGGLPLKILATGVLAFLVLPLLIIVPVSFTSSTLLIFPPPGYSMRWYDNFFHDPVWLQSMRTSLVVGALSTIVATVLGTLVGIGLALGNVRLKGIVTAIVISPMIVPVVITAVASYLTFSRIGLTGSYFGLVLSHAALSLPFVVINVIATLANFEVVYLRASAVMGATPLTTFRKVLLPLMWPGILTGSIFAFSCSFDDAVVALFLTSAGQRTLPVQIFSGIRESVNPTIASAAVLLLIGSAAMLFCVEMLRRRADVMRM